MSLASNISNLPFVAGGANEDARNLSLLEDLEHMAAAASHDLRDPLRLARQHCDALKSILEPGQVFLLESVERCIDETLDRIGLLRSYSFLVQNTEAMEEVALQETLELAERKCQLVMDAKKGKVKAGILPRIMARPRQIEQLFFHLVDNAMKYGGARPVLRVSAERSEGLCRLVFVDEGPGMEPECRHLVFGLFRRLEETIRAPGYGVELAFCRKIAENHGGMIDLETAPGQGARFIVTLPVGR